MRLHIASVMAKVGLANTVVYPVIDGLYACSTVQSEIVDFVKKCYVLLADHLMATTEPVHFSLVRGAIAYGEIVQGRGTQNATNAFQNDQTYRDAILLGMPLVYAHSSEEKASPFGIYVHESARLLPPGTSNWQFTYPHLKWWDVQNKMVGTIHLTAFKHKLFDYFAYHESISELTTYKRPQISAHRTLVEQYFV